MFKISIVQVVEVQKPHDIEYKELHDTPDKGKQYGYVQAPGTKMVQVEREVLSQTVEKLDLTAVIKAVNGIAS